MDPKQQADHNKGQEHGSKSDLIGEIVEGAIPSFGSDGYHKGFRHGVKQKYEAKERKQRSGSGSGSSGGGSSYGSDWGWLLPIGILVIIVSAPFILISDYWERQEAIAKLADLKMNVTVSAPEQLLVDGPFRTLRYANGLSQTLQVQVSWTGPLQESGKPIDITLLHEGRVRRTQRWEQGQAPFGGVLTFELHDVFPQGRYTLRAAVERAKPAEYSFVVAPTKPGTIFVSDKVFNNWPRDAITELWHTPGTRQEIYIAVQLDPPLPSTGKDVEIGLFHQGTTIFNSTYRITDGNRSSYIPYAYDFPEGLYTARLFAQGEPPEEFRFSVRHR